MAITKHAFFPLAVAGGLVAAVAVAVAGGGEDTADPKNEAAAEAPDDEGDVPERPERYKSNLCRRLQCSVDQDGPVYELIVAHREQASARQKEAKTARGRLAELFAADELDDEAMRGVYGEIADAEGKLQLDAYEAIVTLHALLSPEQRVTLGKMLARARPEEILGKRSGGKAARERGKPKRARADKATMSREERAAARAARRDAAAVRGERGRPDPTARRRALAQQDGDGDGDGGLQ